jgi:putative heme iron utilization protein
MTCAALTSQTAPAAARSLTAYDAPARKLLATLSLDEEIGQMTQPNQKYLKSIDDMGDADAIVAGHGGRWRCGHPAGRAQARGGLHHLPSGRRRL